MTIRTMERFVCVACCLFSGVAVRGETHKAAELTPEAVAAAIDAAQDGDTVELPAGKAVWTKGWNAGQRSVMKAITIQGAGIDQTIIVDNRPKMTAGDELFRLNGVEGQPFRLTGITIDGSRLTVDPPGFMVAVNGDCKNFRIDHCRFVNAALMIRIIGDTYGLIDHCRFEAREAEAGLVQPVKCQGPGLANYQRPLSLGTDKALYFEDNEVEFSPEVVDPTGNNPWIAAYGGARIVIRHNSIVNSQLELVGPKSSDVPGVQSAEVYDNAFSAVGLRKFRPQGSIFIDSGVAIVFNNTVTGATYNIKTIELNNLRTVSDTPGRPVLLKADGTNPIDGNRIPAGQPGAGYPHFGQLGWATNVDGQFALTPCYAWGNSINDEPLRMEVDKRAGESELATLKEGREYFNTQPPAEYYTPYEYPHPLQRQEVSAPDAAARFSDPAPRLQDHQLAFAAADDQADRGTSADAPSALLKTLDADRGIVAILETPAGGAAQVVALAQASEFTIYFQSADAGQVEAVRQLAAAAGLLGRRIVAHQGSLADVHLAENVADAILVSPSARGQAVEAELLRVLRPRATAFLGDRQLVKPVPAGIDEWTHPYHGPDNNPQSTDQLVRGALRTQFLADPKFSPMPEQTVIAGGRMYKAMGHIAHKANQNEWLNTLLCINAYNGTILWKRPLSPGFMLHRNTMVATEDALLMGDHESCKVIDARTGEVRREITVPEEITDGPVWKWMALRDGVLYALVGNLEIQVDTITSGVRGIGHWPWGMWKGHDYKDPRTAFGYGRTLVAIELETGKLLWHYRDEEFLDARAVCLNSRHIYCFSGERFLACVDTANGQLQWKNSDAELLQAIGPNGRAQHYITGYATTCYMKCNDRYLFFAGPQRKQMVVASAEDGKLAWTHPDGNLQLVLRDDAIYAAGPQSTGVRLDYNTGSTLGTLPTRRACTRATGCADSVFYRTTGGTVRVMTETNTEQHIAPMRPPCQDGVLISNGHLYWGPWMCGCQLSLYGNIGLAPAPAVGSLKKAATLLVGENFRDVPALDVQPGDWTSYRGDTARTDVTQVNIPAGVRLDWQVDVSGDELPTAPVAAGGLVFIADRSGAVSAYDARGVLVWRSYTGGPIYYPPAIAHDRVYVGSADGRVYALAARTGRFLWSHRVAPEDRVIPVYGNLISTWPVAGGVVVHEGSVYAAAGIAHYDGTHVVRLDAITGEQLAANRESGVLAPEVNGGVSMQGDLMIVDGELQFLGGGVYEIARYDLESLRCLNTPKVQVTSQYRTAFYPYYPEYGKYQSLELTRADGSTLCCDASYEGSVFSNLALESPLPAGETRPRKEASHWMQRRGKGPQQLWQDQQDRRFMSFVVSSDRLLAAGHPDNAPEQAFLAAVNIQDGTDAWVERLPALPVKGGTAIDAQRRIYVTTENGHLLCYSPSN